jgi:hypothetical protein
MGNVEDIVLILKFNINVGLVENAGCEWRVTVVANIAVCRVCNDI